MNNTKFVRFAKINKNAQLPKFAHEGDRCADLFSVEQITIKPFQSILIGTGLVCDQGFDIRPKSGLSYKAIIAMYGTVDHHYRGEIMVNIHNFSSTDFTFNIGDKLAQAYFGEGEIIIKEDTVENIGSTERGAGGFGSTGR